MLLFIPVTGVFDYLRNLSGISFRALPSGHEFSSLILVILNLEGLGKNLPDDHTTRRVIRLNTPIKVTTYISLSCTNCPDVVQAINVMAVLNNNITHEIIDGALMRDEVERLGIQSVPTVYANGETLHIGRGGVAELLAKLEERYGATPSSDETTHQADIAIAGGGAAGATAAIYLARKGLRVAVVAQRVGGQANETSTIENIPSIATISGEGLSSALRLQMAEYPNITLLEDRVIEGVESNITLKKLQIKGGERVESTQLIIATGAEWRRLNIEGEEEYIGRGVTFCPHCDGPLFKGKTVAVIGGGNSGVEAAIDLSHICTRVVVIEFMESLKADELLQKRLSQIDNIEVMTSCETTKILGDGKRVVAIETQSRQSQERQLLDLDGIFVQIGLQPNSALFADIATTNHMGEIEVDKLCRTDQNGIYAAGDVTDIKYKQIVISMGEGAKAALSAFEDRLIH